MNAEVLRTYQAPETATRIQQYEMAYRMQSSVPELLDFSDEPEWYFELYGPESRVKGTYAFNCLLARRLAERDVRFVQLFHMGWDQHENLARDLGNQCGDTDQPTAALIQDLKQRGLLDDTLVIWGGEFGRTIYAQGDFLEGITAAIIIPGASLSSWPAAASGLELPMERPTTSLTTSSAIQSTFMTFTRRFCTCSALTTRC